MDEGSLLDGFAGKSRAAAEFDGQGGGPTAMRLFDGGVETHGHLQFARMRECGARFNREAKILFWQE